MLIDFINLMHEKLLSIIFNKNRHNKNDTLLSKLNIKNIIFLILILYYIILVFTPLILYIKKNLTKENNEIDLKTFNSENMFNNTAYLTDENNEIDVKDNNSVYL
tara:strand:- start:2403 stop:2717 length:315 start_codon:yes stop_codon:yes gene_type:complete